MSRSIVRSNIDGVKQISRVKMKLIQERQNRKENPLNQGIWTQKIKNRVRGWYEIRQVKAMKYSGTNDGGYVYTVTTV